MKWKVEEEERQKAEEKTKKAEEVARVRRKMEALWRLGAQRAQV